jgi:isoquinoline 1-oxidoreductase beta subunit
MLLNIDRRELPRALLRLLGGLALGAFPHFVAAQSTGAGQASALKLTQQPSAFVQIAANGEVTVAVNRLEFGQGVQTALPMILAEELDADWKLVRSRHGSNDAAYVDPLFGIHLTGGSHSVKNSFTQYRELGARARAMLLSAAAARWKVDVASLSTQAGMVLGPDGRKLGYGELADAAISGRGNPAVRPFYCCRSGTSTSMKSNGSSCISASKARNRL